MPPPGRRAGSGGCGQALANGQIVCCRHPVGGSWACTSWSPPAASWDGPGVGAVLSVARRHRVPEGPGGRSGQDLRRPFPGQVPICGMTCGTALPRP
jgi:hypothetical protein